MPGISLYLDYHATTPCDSRVLDAMLPWFSHDFGNPSSHLHAWGRKAADAVQLAREQVATFVGAIPEEITLTSGATEAINLAIKGAACALQSRGKHIVTVQTEHAAVLDTCTRLTKSGFEVTCLDVDAYGRILPGALEAALRPDTILVAIMMANNETGVLQDLSSISSVTRDRGIWLFTDATQAAGKLQIRVDDPAVDMLAFSAHKLYGPKGAGALYIRRRNPRVRIMPLLDGGGHERGMRSGTLNVPAIVGFGEACSLASGRMDTEMPRLRLLRDRFEARISALEQVFVNGQHAPRLPTVSNLSFGYTEGQALHAAIARRLAVSAGSACASAALEPSHVLTAMGRGRELAFASMRISLGCPTTDQELEDACVFLEETVAGQRLSSPLWSLYRQGVLPDDTAWQSRR
jgi:cysteine desulfurase